MYKSRSIWNEEQERQEEKYDNPLMGEDGNIEEYRHHGDYASKDADPSDVYSAAKAGEEKKNKEAKGIEKEVMEQEKKYEKKEETNEEEIKRKAASDAHESIRSEGKDGKHKKSEHKSIEDAIKKAIKEEKELTYVND